ncbi:MAG: 50S ribosomal protein L5 [Elusimicrobia bacterium]|nr:50S ribosomal protein L5 [Elusimicrobiota bacterium]
MAAKEAAAAAAAEKAAEREKAPESSEPAPPPRLKAFYRDQVVPAMVESMGLKNPFQVPHMVKIVINIGVNEAKENIQALDMAREELAQISGQLPQIRRAKKSISNFKLRENMPIAVRVTLRGNRMWEFLDRLVSTAIPRIRDFRGLEPNGFDGNGNYNLGLKEQHIFPEINAEKSQKLRGMNITFVTSAVLLEKVEDKDAVGLELLTRLGMPFKKRAPKGAAKETAAVAA